MGHCALVQSYHFVHVVGNMSCYLPLLEMLIGRPDPKEILNRSTQLEYGQKNEKT
jgi:hypothetical protein